jgi:hypothetical protein
MSGTNPGRPGYSDPRIDQMIAARLLPAVMEWLGPEPHQSSSEVLADLVSALTHAGCDGFDMADFLRHRRNWECDAVLVDILNEAGSYSFEAHRELVKQWVSECHIVPLFKVGDTVTFKQRSQVFVGTITDIRRDTACCAVYSPAAGHVPKGQFGIQAAIIPQEDLELVATVDVPGGAA